MGIINLFSGKKKKTNKGFSKPFGIEGIALKKKFDRNTPEGTEQIFSPEESIPKNEKELECQKKVLEENNSKLNVLKSRSIKNQEILDRQIKLMRENKEVLKQQAVIEKNNIESIKNLKNEILTKEEILKKEKYWIKENSELLKSQGQEIEILSQKVNQLNQQIDIERKTLQSLEYDVSGSRNILESLTSENGNKSKVLEWQKQQISNKEILLVEKEKDVNTLKRDLLILNGSIEQNTERLQSLDLEIKEHEEELLIKTNEVSLKKNILDELTLREEKCNISKVNMLAEIQFLNHENQMLNENISTLKQNNELGNESLIALKKDVEELNVEKNRLSVEYAKGKSTYEGLVTSLEGLSSTKHSLQVETSTLEKNISILKSQLLEKECEIETQKQSIKEVTFVLEENQDQVLELKTENATLQVVLDSQKKNLQEVVALLEAKVHQTNEAIKYKNDLNRKLEECESHRAISLKKLTELEEKKHLTDSELRDVKSKIELIGPELLRAESRTNEIEQQILILQSERTCALSELNKKNEQLSAQTISLKEQESKYYYLETLVNKTKKDLEEKETSLIELKQRLGSVIDSSFIMEKELSDLLHSLKIIDGSLSQTRNNYMEEMTRFEQLKSTSSEMELKLIEKRSLETIELKKLEEMRSNIISLNNDVSQLEDEKLELTERIQNTQDEIEQKANELNLSRENYYQIVNLVKALKISLNEKEEFKLKINTELSAIEKEGGLLLTEESSLIKKIEKCVTDINEAEARLKSTAVSNLQTIQNIDEGKVKLESFQFERDVKIQEVKIAETQFEEARDNESKLKKSLDEVLSEVRLLEENKNKLLVFTNEARTNIESMKLNLISKKDYILTLKNEIENLKEESFNSDLLYGGLKLEIEGLEKELLSFNQRKQEVITSTVNSRKEIDQFIFNRDELAEKIKANELEMNKLDSEYEAVLKEKNEIIALLTELKIRKTSKESKIAGNKAEVEKMNIEIESLKKIAQQLDESVLFQEKVYGLICEEELQLIKAKESIELEILQSNNLNVKLLAMINEKESVIESIREEAFSLSKGVGQKLTDDILKKLNDLRVELRQLNSEIDQKISDIEFDKNVKLDEYELNVKKFNILNRMEKTLSPLNNSKNNNSFTVGYGIGQVGEISPMHAPILEKVCLDFSSIIMSIQSADVNISVTIKQDQNLIVASVDACNIVSSPGLIEAINLKMATIKEDYKKEKLNTKLIEKNNAQNSMSSIKLLLSYIVDDKKLSFSGKDVNRIPGVSQ